MWLRSIRVEGFQSFSDSGTIEFQPGFNFIIGQNNSGKSSLLRAIRPDIKDDRHRAPELWEFSRLPLPKSTFEIFASGKELEDWIFRAGRPINFPISRPQSEIIEKTFQDIFTEERGFIVHLYRSPGNGFGSSYPTLKHFTYIQGQEQLCARIQNSNGRLEYFIQFNGGDDLPSLFNDAWNRDMFYFSAERLAIGQSPSGPASRLTHNASNLPNVLHTLIGEEGDTFQKLVHHIREIFPTVGNISVRLRPDNNELEVRIWPTEQMRGVDLSFPLNESGTGVAQAIAIIATVIRMRNCVIVIDEINSFLHPAAVKSLIRILQTQYHSNQYIISSHSIDLITFSNPKTIHFVNRSGYESFVRKMNLGAVDELRDVAGHLGISMSDVFAADRIIWVEGQTEEICFPYIFQVFSGKPIPHGTVITSVAHTGDFNRNRDKKIVYEVYNRLSSASANLLVATIFSFDSEDLTDSAKRRMVRDSGRRLRFLPRRNIECYLLNPQAIANLMNERDLEAVESYAPDDVSAKMAELAAEKKFQTETWRGDIHEQIWQEKVDGAKIISAIVSDMTQGRVTFSKTKDTLSLMQYIVEFNKECLRPLFEYIDGLVNAVNQ